MIPVTVLIWCLLSIWTLTSAVQEDGEFDYTPAERHKDICFLFIYYIFTYMLGKYMLANLSKTNLKRAFK